MREVPQIISNLPLPSPHIQTHIYTNTFIPPLEIKIEKYLYESCVSFVLYTATCIVLVTIAWFHVETSFWLIYKLKWQQSSVLCTQLSEYDTTLGGILAQFSWEPQVP